MSKHGTRTNGKERGGNKKILKKIGICGYLCGITIYPNVRVS
jgi:hypothetical protein